MRILSKCIGAFVSSPVPSPVQKLVDLMPKLAVLRASLMSLENRVDADVYESSETFCLVTLWNDEGGLKDLIQMFVVADIDERYAEIRKQLGGLREAIEDVTLLGFSKKRVASMIEAITNLQYLSQLDYRKR